MKGNGIKICLGTFNILCLFVGIATFAGGMFIQFDGTVKEVLKSMTDVISSSSIGILSVIMLAVGGLVMLVSFVGCCGVLSESKCMIGLYCTFLILMLIGQLAIGGLGIYYGKQKIDTEFKNHFKELIRVNDASNMKTLNTIQTFFQCCGYAGPNDYPNHTVVASTSSPTSVAPVNASTVAFTVMTDTSVATDMPSTAEINATSSDNMTNAWLATTMQPDVPYTGEYPASCCKTGVEPAYCQNRTSTANELKNYVNAEGCNSKIQAFIQQNAIIIGAVALACAFLEILSITAGCMFYKSLD